MKKAILFLFFVSISFGQNQKLTVVKTSSFPLKSDFFLGFDKYGTFYYIENNVFTKNINGELLQYKNLTLGKIAKVDIENPLKIVLFYENFNTVILLDNQLNEVQKINLSENSIPIVVAGTGIAFGNRLWIYNSLSQQIGLYDYLNNDYKSLTIAFNGNLKYYQSDFNYFQWVDDKNNWNRCDVYGKFFALGKVPDFDQIQIVNDLSILFSVKEQLYLLDTKNNKTYSIEIDEKSFKSFFYKEQILSIFTVEGITNYKITIP